MGALSRTLRTESGEHTVTNVVTPTTAGCGIRILFLIDQLCEPGGTERVLLNIVRGLPAERFSCSIATFRLDSRIPLFQQLPCPVHVIPLRRTYGISGMKAAIELRNLINREQVSVVHSFFETSDLLGGLVAKLCRVPALISSRRDMGILRSRKHRLAYALVNRLFDEVHAVSEQTRQYCIDTDGLDPRRVVTLYNGVAIDGAESADADRALLEIGGLEPGAQVVTTVAHIRQVKGIDVLLRAAAEVRRRRPRAVFLVVGDNHQPAHFKELVELRQALGLAQSVRFCGASENVFGILKTSDVFCLPSRSEGLSNALLEAMACGLPCVATDVGGNAELVEHGRTGLLVPPEDPESIAKAILYLLENRGEAREMGASGRKLVEQRFTTESMIRHLEKRYEHLLLGRQPARRR